MKKIISFCCAICVALTTSACMKIPDIAPVSDMLGNFVNEHIEKIIPHDAVQQYNSRNEECIANSEGMYATQKYIYFVHALGIYRYDRETLSNTLITDAIADIVSVTDDTLYYIEIDPVAPRLYKLTDKMQTPEYMYSLSNDEKFFMDGNYIYSVSQNGSVTKHRNSESQYFNSAKVIYSGKSNQVDEIFLYNQHIYCFDRANHQLISVKIDDGTSEIIDLQGEFHSNGIGSSILNSFLRFSNNKIIYTDDKEVLHIYDVKTKTFQSFSDIEVSSFYVANGLIYVTNYELTEVYSIDTSYNLTPVTLSDYNVFRFSYQLSDTGTEIVYMNSNNEIVICDYSGTILAKSRMW